MHKYILFLKEKTQEQWYIKRSSLPEVFCKTGVLKNFAKFIGKHLSPSLFFNKEELIDDWYYSHVWDDQFGLNCAFVNLIIIFQGYTNADMKIYWYLCLHMKIICRRFHIMASFTFWHIRTRDKWNVCLQTSRNNIIC